MARPLSECWNLRWQRRVDSGSEVRHLFISQVPALRSSHSYPLARSGGLFLLIIGAGLLAAIALSGSALVNYTAFGAALASAIVSLFFARRLSFGSPTRAQVAALVFALTLQGALLALMIRLLPPGTEERIRWSWVSMIVGIHFIPMAVSFGPTLAVLGGGCIATAVAGLRMPGVPYEVFGVVDGLLKVVAGAWLLSSRSRFPDKRCN
jgi:Family of unknown function (DUF6609)